MKRVALVVILLSLSGVSFTFKENAEQKNDELLARIERGRDKLKDERVQMVTGVVGTRRVRVGRRSYREVPVTGIVAREMAIAILEPDGKIKIARALKRENALEVISPDVVLSLRRSNGINSDIQCLQPAGGRVVAVKYPVSNEGNRFGADEPVIQAIYTPYSGEIKTPEVLDRGVEVIDSFIERAYSRLEHRKVYSRAFPGRLVVKVIPKEIVRTLIINEHIDPSEFTSATMTKPLAERVLTVIATNKDKAYAYSISPAGARGLVQMIPSTYRLISNKYPEAELKASFHAAMVDAVNAMVAQVLLCDSDWEAIESKTHIPADRVGPYLAAAYNGGVGRVLTILNHEKTEFMEDPDSNSKPTMTVSRRVPVRVRTRSGRTQKRYVVKSYTRPIFRGETSKYIMQYHWISDYLESLNAKPATSPKTTKPATTPGE
jgi:hypothetical protein